MNTTALSHLSDHDWLIAANTWSRGSDWTVWKDKSRWTINPIFGEFPKYRTKTEAIDAVDERVLAESTRRALIRTAA